MRVEDMTPIRTQGGLELFDPRPDAVYTLEAICHLTGVPRRTVLVYCRNGLISPRNSDNAPMEFSEETVYLIRRIETLKNAHGINLAGIRMALRLMREVDRLRDEMRFLS